ncbi:carboxylate--amine ligase [Natrarchaeobius chitinivorans]|uniref:Carboxylate--amine ligase n=1 Tax=Natrarchaeobius chitinivorans TaxID=1679083 RepID=A0A3N6LNP1_NATCH|nr:ATP-grasp domain-containing protein [Natrarchaeobius chitinivorans]RQG90963.1 carboxylate--amine ligase [Natrarchaeobius chitinivorans]
MRGDPTGPEQKIVIPAIDAASSVACMRSLGKRGIQTVAISEQRRPPGFNSKYCEESIRVPDPGSNFTAYEDALLALARRPDVCTIIPVREADIYALARNKETLTDHVATVWPSIEKLGAVQDRVRLFDAARAADVSIPKTKPVDEWTDWNTDLVVKPRYTVHAPEYRREFSKVRPQEKSAQFVPTDSEIDRAAVVDEFGHVPIVQEYVPNSSEYGFFALYRDGEALATFQHRQRRAWKYSGGPSAYRESVAIPELDAAGRRLLDELEWHGLAMVEFLRDPTTGEFKLMEINPRFWTSLPFTVQAGVDFPHLYWQQATGRPVSTDPAYDVGIGGHLLRGELLHLHSVFTEEYPVVDRPSRVQTVIDIGTSLVRQPRFDYLDLDDPGPFLQDSRNVIGELLSSRAGSPTVRDGERPLPEQ